MLYGNKEDVQREVIEIMENMKEYPNFILSTGCDVPPETPIENLKAFLQAAREYKC